MAYLAGIVGYRGYSGAELVRILDRHSQVAPVLLEHRDDAGGQSRIRGLRSPRVAPCTAETVGSEGLAVVFLATPPEVSMELAPAMLSAGAKVVDLSGAFRLRTAENYAAWYKEAHTAPALLAEAVYGLPEFCRERIRPARLVSNPGCYPTAANLAIRPLVEAGVVDRAAGIVCDAKSGVSGAGRKPSAQDQLLRGDRELLGLLDPAAPACAGGSADLRPRGARIQLHRPTAAARPRHPGDHLLPRRRASTAPRICSPSTRNATPASRSSGCTSPGTCPTCARVARTNFCDIGVTFDAATGRAVVVSAIDNLVKGAAGQAVRT